jgi:uncharacterized protein YkwD
MNPALLLALLLATAETPAAPECPAPPAARAPVPNRDAAGELAILSLDLVNAERRALGLFPLVSDPALVRVARRYAARMRDLGIVGHVAPDMSGHTPGKRLAAEGVSDAVYGENVGMQASDRADPAVLVHRLHQGLLSSPPHRANLLNPDFNMAGVGIALGTNPADSDGPEIGRRSTRTGDGSRTDIPAVWIAQCFVARRLDLAMAQARIVPEGIEVELVGVVTGADPCRILLVRLGGMAEGDGNTVESDLRDRRFSCRLLLPSLCGRRTIELCPLSPGRPVRVTNALILDTDAPPPLTLSSRLAWE